MEYNQVICSSEETFAHPASKMDIETLLSHRVKRGPCHIQQQEIEIAEGYQT